MDKMKTTMNELLLEQAIELLQDYKNNDELDELIEVRIVTDKSASHIEIDINVYLDFVEE